MQMEERVRKVWDQSPWMWEHIPPEDRQAAYEKHRERMLAQMELNRYSSTGTGRGAGKRLREERWAGREKEVRNKGRRQNPREPR